MPSMDKSIPDKRTKDLNTNIDLLRRAIDEIDEKILELINQRLSLAKQVGDFKKQSGIQITDSDREKKIMNRCFTYLFFEGIKTSSEWCFVLERV